MSVKPTATGTEPGTGQSQPGRRPAWPHFGSRTPDDAHTRPHLGAHKPGEAYMADTSMTRRYAAELIGTGLLVFFGAGMATINFGFRAFGSSVAAGILLTGLTFGLVLLALFALLGPVSGCHINPAVSFGFWLARRMTLMDMIGYWIAQMIGGLLGALLLWAVLNTSPFYSRARIGLGANGYNRLSLLHIGGGGAFLTEVIVTALLVLVVLGATRRNAPTAAAGIAIGLALAIANFMAIPIDGASVNPARSFGPAIVVGGLPLSQLWLFLIAPLAGGLVAALVFMLFGEGTFGRAGAAAAGYPVTTAAAEEGVPETEAGRVGTATPAMPPGAQRVVSGGEPTRGAVQSGSGQSGSVRSGSGQSGSGESGSAQPGSGQSAAGQPSSQPPPDEPRTGPPV
jgi:aquaporin Z